MKFYCISNDYINQVFQTPYLKVAKLGALKKKISILLKNTKIWYSYCLLQPHLLPELSTEAGWKAWLTSLSSSESKILQVKNVGLKFFNRSKNDKIHGNSQSLWS